LIIVSGKLYVHAHAREEYLRGCVSVIEQARRAHGCLDFVLAADPIEPDRINVYERWESDADLEVFRGAGPEDEQMSQLLDVQVETYPVVRSVSGL
jgi:quinol monooxygenase YgiN